MCKMDNRQEAKENDEYAVGMYDKSKQLCGHVPIELSFLCYTFLHNSAENEIIAVVDGHRLLENGLVVPAVFHSRSKSKKVLNVYLEELKKLITL